MLLSTPVHSIATWGWTPSVSSTILASCFDSKFPVTFSWKSAPSSLATARRSGTRSNVNGTEMGKNMAPKEPVRLQLERVFTSDDDLRRPKCLGHNQTHQPDGSWQGREKGGLLQKNHRFFLVFTKDWGVTLVHAFITHPSVYVIIWIPLSSDMLPWFKVLSTAAKIQNLLLFCTFHPPLAEFYLHHRLIRSCRGSHRPSGMRVSLQTEVLSEPPPQRLRYRATWFVEQ